MRYFALFFSPMLAIVAMAGCHKSTLLTYTTKSDIYFNDSIGSYFRYPTDHIDSSFAQKPDSVVEDTVHFFVRATGRLSSLDRPFHIAVNPTLSTATAGKDYQLLSNDSFFIPAGQAGRRLSLLIFKTPDLYQRSVTLVLQLQPNNNYDTLISVLDASATPVLSMTSLTIVVDNILGKPSFWDRDSSFLGTYSRKKITLMAQVLGLTPGLKNYSTTQLYNFAAQMQEYLDDQSAMGNPILDDDGSPMVMGPDVQ